MLGVHWMLPELWLEVYDKMKEKSIFATNYSVVGVSKWLILNYLFKCIICNNNSVKGGTNPVDKII